METMNKKVTLVILGVLVIALAIALFVSQQFGAPTASTPEESGVDEVVTTTPASDGPTIETIGTSVEGRAIEQYTFGSGERHLLFVGGIHGGYEWNSSLLAWQSIDYFTFNPEEVPSDLTISIIPSLNPDGLALVTGTGGRFSKSDVSNPGVRNAEARMNANGVDLNRNFGCKWQPESTWRGNVVSAGTSAFSEPEAMALKNLVETDRPDAVLFWHSQANNVYASECQEGVLPATLTLMNTYATAGNYGAVPVFDAYPITGDAEGWLASIGIPAVTVELESFSDIEWERNRAGIYAVMDTYSNIAK